MEDYVPVTLEDIPTIVKNVFRDGGYRSKGFAEYRLVDAGNVVLALLAIDFCSDIKTARELKKDLKTKQITQEDALSKILKSWIGGYAHSGGKAPFEEFVDALFSHGLTSLGVWMMDLFVDLSHPRDTDEIVPVPISTSSSLAQEQALTNELTIEKIYQNLSFWDKREFHLVNKLWRNQGLRLWRNSAQIKIWKDKNRQDQQQGYGVHMQEFVELYKKAGEDGNGNSGVCLAGDDSNLKVNNCWKLSKHPYRFYSVDMDHDGAEVTEENHKVYEKEFWNMCGPLMERLTLSGCFGYNPDDGDTENKPFQVFKNVLLGFCPNLKEIEANNSKDKWTEVEKIIWEPQEFPEGKFADKLQSLILNNYTRREEDIAKILQICPNLKSLVIREGRHIGKLLKPAVNGKFIELKQLKITCFCLRFKRGDSLQFLRSYVEKFPKALTHLDIGHIDMAHRKINTSRSNFFAAIGQCQFLQSLKLNFCRFSSRDCNWFIDLSIFAFPNLVELTVKYRANQFNPDIYFDFGALKGMPKLEELNLKIAHNLNNFQRRPGTEDWIYEGSRDLFAPADVKTNVYSEEEPIRCESLKKFCFHGWEINAEDVRLISNWAPNLTYLDALFTSDVVPLLLESWEKLERLKIHSTGIIPLSYLRTLKEKKKNLKIVVHPYKGWGFEIKEFNGLLYYDWAEWD